MSKDTTQVKTAGPNCRLWLAPVGTAEPAHSTTAFSASWSDMGYLEDPPSIARAISKTDLNAWNAGEPLRSLLDSDVSTVGLKLMQTNRATFELYFGPLIYTADLSAISIEPDPTAADVEKIMCLELVDGTDILRIYWRRVNVSDVGNLNMDKAGAISYEVTLKRLTPSSGNSFRISSNILGLVSA